MSGAKVKVCGLKSYGDIDNVNCIHPEFIGFVFVRGSKRYIAPERAVCLRSRLAAGILPVGVFRDVPCESIVETVEMGAIEMIQLHGGEDDGEISFLRRSTGIPVIKAFRVTCSDDVMKAEDSAADYVLLDGGAGGAGESFDWSLAKCLKRPFFLAGGLAPENVGAAISVSHPYAVDVSSGVEIAGLKDFCKMRNFIDAVRGADK